MLSFLFIILLEKSYNFDPFYQESSISRRKLIVLVVQYKKKKFINQKGADVGVI